MQTDVFWKVSQPFGHQQKKVFRRKIGFENINCFGQVSRFMRDMEDDI
jgi:hypothetical protein